jgi:hypothetical protein
VGAGAGEPEDRWRRAGERRPATGAKGTDLDEARELAARDPEEEAAVRREREADPDPTRRDPPRGG